MKLHFATVPVFSGGEAAEDDLNAFLVSHRVISVDRQLIADGPRSAWTVCVTYVEGSGAGGSAAALAKKGRVDYREVLPPEMFQVFVRLRELRKKLADRDGVPPYALFNNEQLAEMVRRQVSSLTALGAIDGVGPARLEKYGAAFLEVLQSFPVAVVASGGEG
jgi:superfamily II DNA helicase RecQ